MALLLDGWIRYVMTIIQNATYFFGDLILNQMLEAPLTRILDFYQLTLTLPPYFKGQTQSDEFRIDLRHVPGKDPFMGEGYMDLLLNGEWFYQGKNCDNIQDDYIHFYDTKDYSQLVIGQSLTTCILNQMAKSKIFQLQIDTMRFNMMFGVQGYELTTTSMKDRVKIFAERAGPNKQLVYDISFSDIELLYGQDEKDVSMNFTMCFGVSLAIGGTELIADCLPFHLGAHVRADSDVLFIDLAELYLDLRSTKSNRLLPKRNKMDMTEADYRDFLEDA